MNFTSGGRTRFTARLNACESNNPNDLGSPALAKRPKSPTKITRMASAEPVTISSSKRHPRSPNDRMFNSRGTPLHVIGW